MKRKFEKINDTNKRMENVKTKFLMQKYFGLFPSSSEHKNPETFQMLLKDITVGIWDSLTVLRPS